MKKLLSTSALCLGIIGAAAVEANAQNNLFVTNSGSGDVSGYSTTTGAPVASITGSFFRPNGIAADASGNLYVSDYNIGNNTSAIREIQSGPVVSTLVTNANNTLQNPKGLTLGPGGNLYTSNGSNNPGNPVPTYNILQVGTGANAGNVSVYATGTPGAGPGVNTATPYVPDPIAYDGSRYLYVADFNSKILRIDTQSANHTFAPVALTGVASGSVSNPTGLAFGPDGALYISNAGQSDILRVTLDPAGAATGTFTIYAANNTGPNVGVFSLGGLEGIAFDPASTALNPILYVAQDDDTIRRITAGGAIDNGFVIQEPAGAGPAYIAFSPIPEPSAYALFGVAGAAMLVFGLKRRQQLTLRA